MTAAEVQIEAALRWLIPEGNAEDFTPRQREILSMADQWRECFEQYGEDSGAARGALLDLVRAACGDRFAHCARFINGPRVGQWYVSAAGWTRSYGSTELDALAGALGNAAP